MIVQLPSNGLYGLRQVNLRTPKVGDLREIASASYTEEQIRTEFVRLLIDDATSVFDRITIYDRDYLFAIAASGVCMNRITIDFVCPYCKGAGRDVMNQTVYDITDQEIVVLDDGTPSEVVKSWDGMDVTYRILRVSDEERIVAYALADYEHYASRYEQAFTAGILGQPMGSPKQIEEGIAVVNSYPMYVYFSALLFSQMTYHGVPTTCIGRCRECGRESKVVVPFGQAVTQLDSGRLINRFSQLSGMVSYKDFLDLSMPELSQLEANLRVRE